MKNLEETTRAYRVNERSAVLVNRILAVLMLWTVAFNLVELLKFFAPKLLWELTPWLGLLAAVAVVIMRMQPRRHAADQEYPPWVGQVIELAVLLLAAKLIQYVYLGWDQLRHEFVFSYEQFLPQFFNTEFILAAIVVACVWGAAHWLLNDLEEIEEDVLLLEGGFQEGGFSNRAQLQRNMNLHVLSIGSGMVLMRAFTRLEGNPWATTSQSSGADLGTVMLGLYFVLALGLFSQLHLAVLRSAWVWQRVPTDLALTRRWVGYSLAALALVALLAAVLPSTYSLGFLQTLGYVLTALMAALYWLGFLLISPFFVLIGLLLSFLQPGTPPPSSFALPTPRPILPPPLPLEYAAAPPDWIGLAQSVLFWLFFAGVINFVLVQYVRSNQAWLNRLSKDRGWSWLAGILAWLGARGKAIQQGAARSLAAGLEKLRALRPGEPVVPAWPVVNPLRRSPRQQVLFYYQALLRRAGQSGLARRPDQTPEEYAQSLRQRLAERQPEQPADSVEQANSDIALLTAAFEEARYTRHPIPPAAASQSRKAWNALAAWLRRLRS